MYEKHFSGQSVLERSIQTGILKNYTKVFPELGSEVEHLGQDLETLHQSEIDGKSVKRVVQLIYLPRITLVKKEYLSEAIVRELDEDTIETIVYDSLQTYLQSQNISIEEDLEFDVGSLETEQWEEHI